MIIRIYLNNNIILKLLIPKFQGAYNHATGELLALKAEIKSQMSNLASRRPVYRVLKAAGEPRGRGQEAQQ